MSPTRSLPLASLLALLVATSAAANATSFTRITWNKKSTTLFGSSSKLVVEASGAARLEPSYPVGAVQLGAPPRVLQGQLQPAELQALDAALGAPGLTRLPRQLPAGFGGDRFELHFELSGGRPALRAEGYAGRFGDHAALLSPVEQVLDAVRSRLQASSTELLLEVDRVPLPGALLADQDLDLVVEGPGLPGVEFASLRAVLKGRTLTIQALGRQVPLAPARRFAQRLRVERPGRAGVGYLHVKYHATGYGNPQVLIVQPETAQRGLFTGKIVTKKGQVSLLLQTGRKENRLLRLDAAGEASLGRFPDEYAKVEGELDSEGRLRIRRLIQPERRRVEGLALRYGSVRGLGVGHVSTFGPAAHALASVEAGTPVVAEGWFFAEGGWTPPRKWHQTGMRSIYRAQRLYVERVRAKVTRPVKLKRGWKKSGELQAGEEVWVGKRRLFGWAAEVESLDGSRSGRARFKKRFDFAQPAKLASETPGGPGGTGIIGGLGSVSGS